MLLFKRIPKLLSWILSVMIVFLLAMTISRFVFYWKFDPLNKPFSIAAFIMGLRFDLKFLCMLGAFMMVVCALPFINPFKNDRAKGFWNLLLPIVFTLLVFIYVVDYFHYSFIQQRLNASILSYFQDAAISLNMAYQSYPLVKAIILLILLLIAATVFFKKLLSAYQQREKAKGRVWAWYVGIFLLFALGVFGKIGQFNLRWSDAFTLNDNFEASLALNPLQSFFSTLSFRDTKPDINKTRAGYALMASYLGVQNPDSVKLNYERHYTFSDSLTSKPNVVVVICESFCMYRSTMGGNPYNTTPYFDELCKNGVFHDRCFTPSFPTARGVWATVTGIPDALGDNNRTASRNPETVDQQTIINDIKGYDKFYFLGGDPTWANIKGLLLNNIDGLHLYSQDDFKAKKADVWGIDDMSLFLEANDRLAQEDKPFFAIIQTADNHGPYTIPAKALSEFKEVEYPMDSLRKYGFDNNPQLNAFRYTDFCYRKFFEAARKEKYFDNTIFVFVGDHGIPGNADQMYPKSWSALNMTREHVPLLFYSPKLLKPQVVHNVCSQIDIMPSVASLLKVPYSNNAMGRNLFDTAMINIENAFIIDHEAETIGTVTNQYTYQKNIKTGKVYFESVINNDPIPENAQTDSIKNYLAMFTDDYYETAKYLLFNNKKR
ncbi:MAG TPA: sulfatase-like hydrolase/transferase [Ferruginibacter sp.]|jgi:phosphoglycerol transferase MdoB-like AlkP superfamily enzyme|nr:sulfatase-like hydrolase/transferase [Ferruginibacter sp.]